MRRKVIVAGAALALLLGACSREPEKFSQIEEGARAVLEKAIESMGGDAVLKQMKGMRMKGAGTYKSAASPMPMPYTSEVVYVAPDKLLWQIQSMGMTMATGMYGDTAWSQMMSPAARVAGPMKVHLDEWKFTHKVTLVRPLLEIAGAKITVGEAQQDEGKTSHRIHIEFTDGHKYDLTFVEDQGKTFLRAWEGDMTYWDGRKGSTKVKLSQPKTFGDVTLPSSVEAVNIVGGEIQETVKETVSAIEWNPPVEEEVFHMPPVTLPLMKAAVKQTVAVQGVMVVHKGDYKTMGDSIRKVMNICHENGLMPMGAVTSIHLNDPASVKDPSELRTEIVAPVMLMGPPPQLPEGASMKQLEALEVASMSARGPYGDADVKALEAVMAWVKEQGFEVAGAPRILYFHQPDMFVAEDLISEAQVPIRKP